MLRNSSSSAESRSPTKRSGAGSSSSDRASPATCDGCDLVRQTPGTWTRWWSRRMYLWRAVDSEGEILDLLVQPRHDKAAALRLMRKLVRKQGYAPHVLVTDKLKSYGAARLQLGLSARDEQGLRKNNGLRIRIRSCDDGNARCSASNPLGRPSASSRSKLRSTTPLWTP